MGYTGKLAGIEPCPSLTPPDVSQLEQYIIGNQKAGVSAAKITTDEWVTMQCQDPEIGKIYELLQSKKLNIFKASDASSPQVKWMLKIRHQVAVLQDQTHSSGSALTSICASDLTSNASYVSLS